MRWSIVALVTVTVAACGGTADLVGDARGSRIRRGAANPEPGDRQILDARLRTRARAAGAPKDAGGVKKVLYTKDVSRTNPFKDPFAAPAGPDTGPGRRIGAFVPPRDVTSVTAASHAARHCDPLLNPACGYKAPGVRSKRFKGASDPDEIRNAPRWHTELRPLRSTGRGFGRKGPGAASADPYGETSRAATAARNDMLSWRRASKGRALGYDPRKTRNYLPVDNTGPTGELSAMRDPLPAPPQITVQPRADDPAAAASADAWAPAVSARRLGLDPYAAAAAALRPTEDGRGRHGAPLHGDAPPDAHAGGEASAKRRALLDRVAAGDPDSPLLGQPQADPAHRFSRAAPPAARLSGAYEYERGYAADAPVRTVGSMGDPLPRGGDVAAPAYIAHPRDAATAEGFTEGPMSYGGDGSAPPEAPAPAAELVKRRQAAFKHEFGGQVLPRTPEQAIAAEKAARTAAKLARMDVGDRAAEQGYEWSASN